MRHRGLFATVTAVEAWLGLVGVVLGGAIASGTQMLLDLRGRRRWLNERRMEVYQALDARLQGWSDRATGADDVYGYPYLEDRPGPDPEDLNPVIDDLRRDRILMSDGVHDKAMRTIRAIATVLETPRTQQSGAAGTAEAALTAHRRVAQADLGLRWRP